MVPASKGSNRVLCRNQSLLSVETMIVADELLVARIIGLGSLILEQPLTQTSPNPHLS